MHFSSKMFNRVIQKIIESKSITRRNGLLVAANPKNIGEIFEKAENLVKDKLYVQLLPAINRPSENYYSMEPDQWANLSPIIRHIYEEAARICPNLDVRVLLSNLKNRHLSVISTNHPVDTLIFDQHYDMQFTSYYAHNFLRNANLKRVESIHTGEVKKWEPEAYGISPYKHVVVSGAFDRLHVAHKNYLSEAALRSSFALTVGVSEESALQGKILHEIIEDIDVRMANVKDFVTDICPHVSLNVTPLTEQFNPVINDSSVGLLVMSEDHTRKISAINEVRQKNGVPTLSMLLMKEMEVKGHVGDPITQSNRISSGSKRVNALGTVINPIKPNPYIPKEPYVIGLTGTWASGKTEIAQKLEVLGAKVINCRQLEQSQVMGPAKEALKKEFGDHIIDGGKHGVYIDHVVLGKIMYKDMKNMHKYYSIVWPLIAKRIEDEIKNSESKIVVLQYGDLAEAGWTRLCHEVWTTILPEEERLVVLQDKHYMDPESARLATRIYPSDKYYAKIANVVLSPRWGEKFTDEQVNKAWKLLQERIQDGASSGKN